ncbi:MAG: 1-deoxy-D-xylulose-5-phosphate synthase [Deltaproteobacteria bacterium]|nr:1-deoxy-D-xylulose-5-phosphate synthase [Deltaproteobacteria bacterium]
MSVRESLLARIHKPHDVAQLDAGELLCLAEELRERIIETVSRNGGHLAPSLGVVELTLALCAVFNPDQDKVIWDVGHQCYAWKLLTGRADRFATLRKLGGLSGFPKPCESPYDHFGVGHSSTSLSAALGMAMARDLHGQTHHVLAVIGDGSLTGGQALEGLNLAGDMQRRLIVVLNDNEMSISPNVGSLSLFLSRTLTRAWVRQTKKDVLRLLRSIPRIGGDLVNLAQRSEQSFKSFFTPGMLFEAFRFHYLGPVQGHDLKELTRHLHMAAQVEDRPVLLHVLTHKGKGYPPAENNPTYFHGIGGFEPETGRARAKGHTLPGFTEVFGDTLCALAENDPRVVAITAAMPEGTGTSRFQECFPERFVDVGICEQHAVTFAAGLAKEGFKPVVAVYSTFLQRGYDQIVHDVCLQQLPVVFCLDRAGLVGEDGPTHHGVFDIAYLRHIPHMKLLAPRDEDMLRHALATALNCSGPVALRYPRGAGYGAPMNPRLAILPTGRGEMLAEGKDALVITLGSRVHPALEAVQRLHEETGAMCAVFDPIWAKPLPEEELLELAARYDTILLMEEGVRAGGFSSSVLELWADQGALKGQRIRRLGIPDSFVEHGAQQELRVQIGLCVDGIAAALQALMQDEERVAARLTAQTR